MRINVDSVDPEEDKRDLEVGHIYERVMDH